MNQKQSCDDGIAVSGNGGNGTTTMLNKKSRLPISKVSR